MNQHKKERYAAANFKVILKQFPFPIPIFHSQSQAQSQSQSLDNNLCSSIKYNDPNREENQDTSLTLTLRYLTTPNPNTNNYGVL